MISPLAAVVYADLFGYPLTVKEAELWAIRKTREKYSREKEKLALEGVTFLRKIPTVEAVFLTGSVVVKNATQKADADLMIITKPSTLWLTRLIVFKKLKSFACPNIFLDTNHLEIQDKNLYTAHEVLQAKCLYDKNNINYLWLKRNEWTKEHLPNAYKQKINQSKSQFPISNTNQSTNSQNWILDIGYWSLVIGGGHWLLGVVIGFIELCAFIFQYFYMKPKITNERVGWGYAFFHPNDLSEKVLKKFEKNLKKLNLTKESKLSDRLK